MAFHGTLRFADDVVAQFEASFRSPQRQRLEVVGEEGVLVVEAPWRVDWGGAVTLARRTGGEEALGGRDDRGRQANSYRLELENLADAIAGRAAPLLGRDDALGQARAIEALYRSAEERPRRRRRVRIAGNRWTQDSCVRYSLEWQSTTGGS